jgi:hypothetical protein
LADFFWVTIAFGVNVPFRCTTGAPCWPFTIGVNAPLCSARSTWTGLVPSLPKVTVRFADLPSRTVALRLVGDTVRCPALSRQFFRVVKESATFTFAVAGVYFPSVAWNFVVPACEEYSQ